MADSVETLRVLIVAEHASLRFGGEAALPLHYFRVLRKRGVETWMIVHERTREELTRLLPDEADRIHFIRDTAPVRLLWRTSRLLPDRLAHFSFGMVMRLLTQRTQKKQAKQLIRQHRIDVVHQPMPVSPREPSLLHALGAPVVIGPMNGSINYPPAFKHMQTGFVNASMAMGRWSAFLLNTIWPGKRRAAVLLVANARTREALPGGVRGRVIELVENGVDLSVWTTSPKKPDASSADSPRFVFIGRLVDWKAVDLLLEAFGKVVKAIPHAQLEVIGDGLMRSALEQQAKRLGLLEVPQVIFAGWLSQAQAAQRLQEADALVLPSLLECGGAVVLEAMASSRPAIATNWGGPTDYLNEDCGMLVTPDSRDGFVAKLADAMIRLGCDPQLRKQMGDAGGRRVVEHFDWEKKVDRMLDIYRQAIESERNLAGVDADKSNGPAHG